MKDDSRSGRHSTSRTDVNVERVTVLTVANQLYIKKEQCLRNYHRRYWHAESLRTIGAKTAER